MSEEARESAARLESAFARARAAPPPPAPQALLARIMADAAAVAAERDAAALPAKPPQSARAPSWLRALLAAPAARPAFACAAAAAFGLWLGQSAPVAEAAEALLAGPDGTAEEFSLALLDEEERW